MTRKKTTVKEPQTFQTEVKPKISKKDQIGQIIKSKTKNKFLSKGQEEYYDKLTNNQIKQYKKLNSISYINILLL